MKRTLFYVPVIAALAACAPGQHTAAPDYGALDALLSDRFNFIVANDLGRNGYYDQRPIAERMGELAGTADIEFIAAAGDVHHFEGVASIDDPLWTTNYETVYAHPELMIDWFPVLGNHEYRGNTQAVLDYGRKSRRWSMPGRYYTRAWELDDGASLRIVWIDTAPLIDKYRNDTEKYPDVCRQDMERQLRWIDSTLNASHETWKVVIGHHPVYAQTPKEDSERTDLQQRLDPLLRRYGVDLYVAGHIHNFQHLRAEGSCVDYVVNSSGSLARPVAPTAGTRFCSPEPGFSVISASADRLELHMLDRNCRVVHTVTRERR